MLKLLHLILCNLILLLMSHYVAMTPVDHQVYQLSNCSQEDLRQIPAQSTALELSAEHCNISELENALFLRFSKLQSLEIVESKINTLQDYALNGLNELRVLSLARNNITEVKSWTNEPMRALISLDLRRNAIRTLTLKSFIRYPNLQRLNLAHNLLDDIDDGIFRWMPHLKYLNLGRNQLKVVEARNFHGMQRLTHLALHNNNISEIEWMSFQTNTHLRSLRLESNKLRDLEFMTVMNLMRLVHLNLSHNAIDSLDRLVFSKDFELRDLDLSYNRLTEVVEGTFGGLESLEMLNISHNDIQSIEAFSFQDLIGLKHIDLSSNNLSELPVELFNGSAQLQHINISTNALITIDSSLFTGLSQLNVLDISANHLESQNFLNNFSPDLERSQLHLNLSRNLFTTLNMSSLVDFQSVELAGNAWNCIWLIQEMLRIPSSIHFGRNYSVAATWSNSLFDVDGIECYDGGRKRHVMILQPSRYADCVNPASALRPITPPLNWPNIRLDSLDSRSVIIWMLIAVIFIFSAIRIARLIITHKKRRQMAKQPATEKCPASQTLVGSIEEFDNMRNRILISKDLGARASFSYN